MLHLGKNFAYQRAEGHLLIAGGAALVAQTDAFRQSKWVGQFRVGVRYSR